MNAELDLTSQYNALREAMVGAVCARPEFQDAVTKTYIRYREIPPFQSIDFSPADGPPNEQWTFLQSPGEVLSLARRRFKNGNHTTFMDKPLETEELYLMRRPQADPLILYSHNIEPIGDAPAQNTFYYCKTDPGTFDAGIALINKLKTPPSEQSEPKPVLLEGFTEEEINALSNPDCPGSTLDKFQFRVLEAFAHFDPEEGTRSFTVEHASDFNKELGGLLPDSICLDYIDFPKLKQFLFTANMPKDKIVGMLAKIAPTRADLTKSLNIITRTGDITTISDLRKHPNLQSIRGIGKKSENLLKTAFSPVATI